MRWYLEVAYNYMIKELFQHPNGNIISLKPNSNESDALYLAVFCHI